MKKISLLLFLALLSCKYEVASIPKSKVSVIVLGTVQDGGSPHIGCKRDCCATLFLNPDPNRKVVSIGLIDRENDKTFLFEATPDIPTQLKKLKEYGASQKEIPDGIFLTHAHIGHYTGLMFLGKEALGAKNALVYTMPKMKTFLENNGPWNQLIDLNNILLKELKDNTEVKLSSNLSILPFTVPHRDEFSETVGFKIIGPDKSLLFIPDIDKWSKWNTSIINEIKKVDYAFLDASFFDQNELNNRDISEIPHPFVIESMALFKNLPISEKNKINFIHFNHTNPLLNIESKQAKMVLDLGFTIATFGQEISL